MDSRSAISKLPYFENHGTQQAGFMVPEVAMFIVWILSPMIL